VDRLGIYSNLHIVHCGPQGLTSLRDGEPSMSATTAPPDAQFVRTRRFEYNRGSLRRQRTRQGG
jgi:hypothetical protein